MRKATKYERPKALSNGTSAKASARLPARAAARGSTRGLDEPLAETAPVPTASPSVTEHADVLILGAGAAGLLCARTAARRGRKVVLLDHAPTPGRKIAVSGGGKANFTNLHMDARHFIGHDEHLADFCEPVLNAFGPRAVMALLSEHGLAWEEREHGQLFGLEKATLLVDALVRDCQKAGCLFVLGHSIEAIEHTTRGFVVRATREGNKGTTKETAETPAREARNKGGARTITAASLVLALGSSAWPQVGASDAGAHWARHLGHHVHPFRPVLAPLHMPALWPLQGLSGISLKVRLRTRDYERVDDLLFTHSGISGPVTLQLSCRWQPGQEIIMDFLPHTRFDALLDAPENGKLLVRTLLCRHMPQRLAEALLPEDLSRRKVAELSRAARTALRDAVHSHRVIPAGHDGLRRAEAAAGGVSTAQINAWSMESLLTPGLFVVGELLDVTGHLGGYNLHWAWASGYMGGQNA